MTEEEIKELAVETAENIRKIMEMPNFINGEEIEPIEKSLKQVKNCFLYNGNNKNSNSLFPSDEEFEKALEKEAFRVPYDGSNNFYDESTLEHWRNCWKWTKNAINDISKKEVAVCPYCNSKNNVRTDDHFCLNCNKHFSVE